MLEPHATNVARRQRYGAVLVAIVIACAIQGIASPGRGEQLLVSALLGFVFLLSLWETGAHPRFRLPAALIVAGAIISSIVASATGEIDGAASRLPDALLVVLALPTIVVGLARNVRVRREVTLQTVLGVLSVYLLLGIFFANVYVTINRLGGNPFFVQGQPANVAHCIYYSFTTMTTVGYGDLTARTNLGHTLSVSEGLLGQIYLVTVVALIVSNLRPRGVSQERA